MEYSYFNYRLGRIVSGEVLDFEDWLAENPNPNSEDHQADYDAYRAWAVLTPDQQYSINVSNLPSHLLTDRILGGVVTAVASAIYAPAGAATRASEADSARQRAVRPVITPAAARLQTLVNRKRRMSAIVAQRLRLGRRRRFIPL